MEKLLLKYKRWRIRNMKPREYYMYVFSKMRTKQLEKMLYEYVDKDLNANRNLFWD